MIKKIANIILIFFYITYVVLEIYFLITDDVNETTLSNFPENVEINIAKIVFSMSIVFCLTANKFKRVYLFALIGIASTLIADILTGFTFRRGTFIDSAELLEIVSFILIAVFFRQKKYDKQFLEYRNASILSFAGFTLIFIL